MVKAASYSYVRASAPECLNQASVLVQTQTRTNIDACTASECVSKYLHCMHKGALSLPFSSVSVWLCGCDLAAPPFNIAAEASWGAELCASTLGSLFGCQLPTYRCGNTDTTLYA